MLSFAAAGCLGSGAAAAVDFGPPDHGRSLAGVEYFSDDDRMCGPASLTAVLDYHGLDLTLEETAEAIFRKDIRGAIGLDLALFARAKGFEAVWATDRPALLIEEIEAGRPLLVMLDYGFSVASRRHFTVVTGFSQDGVSLYNGENPTWESFLSLWKKTGYWNLKIVPPAGGAS
jgi:predicted double-glycine peptidase